MRESKLLLVDFTWILDSRNYFYFGKLDDSSGDFPEDMLGNFNMKIKKC